ncbi:immune inhibitor A domain-containing protein [Oceanirhabdus seepicola]|uniref:Immune inhibitor A n=1 Tax=Oceanirhabdus seepicola TaxID=2828781 RepID=A0A9J6P925_9CLOT|nr:immune inhibitor A domain-containing protein [Oceanirhabdus seepicola]MCM1992815.1 immune inhibitor A [Oceanirhabdus seepicola]
MLKKFVAFITAATLLFSTSVSAKDVNENIKKAFIDAPNVVENKDWDGETFKAKPLIVLMNFKDYKYTDLDEKESWTINERKGEEFTPELYEKMFFGENVYTAADGNEYVTVNKYFLEESGGSYSFDGEIFGWYEAQNGYEFYGANTDPYGTDQQNAAELVKEALTAVSNDHNIDLSEFDVEDKYDYDSDGNYLEPDGIIDSIIVIHAGRGEEWDNALGENAIWPFRHKFIDFGEFKCYEFKDHNDKEWKANDFAVFEQDLPLDLFIHEYGHILGLPDLYGSEPPVEYWSVMGGSYTGKIRGTMPNGYGAYCRNYLQKEFESKGMERNWENLKTISLEEINENGLDFELDQASLRGENHNTIKIELPKREYERVSPYEGENLFFSGKGDYLNNNMIAEVDLSNVNNALLTFKTWYDIDPEFDYASVQVREKGTEKWNSVKGNITTDVNPNDETPDDPTDRNPGFGITYDSGNEWVDAEFDLSMYSGKTVEFKFNWWTDTNTPEEGIYIDNIKILSGEEVIFEDNAEEESKFVLNGFIKSNGKEYATHYYLLEWRNGNNGLTDQGLNYGWKGIQYDPGLVIWYINEKWTDAYGRPDQYTKGHPGEAFAAVVDADQSPVVYKYDSGKGGADYSKFQMHDAAFSLNEHSQFFFRGDKYKYISVDNNTIMNPAFDDSMDYSNKEKESLGVKLSNYGLNIFVTDESKDRSTAKIHIAKKGDNQLEVQKMEEEYIKDIVVKGDKISVQAHEAIDSMEIVYKLSGDEDELTNLVNMKKEGNRFEGNIDFIDGLNNGKYEISFIQIKDGEGNTKGIYNSSLNNGFGVDLSNGNISTLFGFNDLKIEEKNNSYTFKIDSYNRTAYTQKLSIVIGKEFENGDIKYDTKSFNIKSFGEFKDNIKVEKNDQVKSIRIFILDKDMNILKDINS